MTFNNKEEALQSRIKFMEIHKSSSDYDKFTDHSKKYGFFEACDLFDHRKVGKFFLYEKSEYKHHDIGTVVKLSYPKMGIYINELPCDQTTEVEWLDYRRSWEWQTEYKYVYVDKDGVSKEFTNYIAELGSEIQRLPLWFDDLLVYGSWDSIPNWKQLKQAYERTWWFHRDIDEKRDIQLDNILG